jgi:hypothetical protein
MREECPSSSAQPDPGEDRRVQGTARAEDTPELLSRRIIERSEQIQCALSAGSSEIEIAMCAMGYSACADDLLALIEL